MRKIECRKLFGLALSFIIPAIGYATDEPERKKSKSDGEVVKILKVDGKEALSKGFSMNKAVDYLDRTSMAWTNKHKCFTCHTNFIHLMAMSDFEKKPKYYADVKKSLDEMVTKRWASNGPRWDAEVIMSATALAFVDRSGPKKLSPNTKMALDRIWTVQREDGGFDWLKCDWPPMESDDEYGAAIAAVGVSAAPEAYSKSKKALAGIAKLKKYIAKQGLKKLHHRAMLIWAESLGGEWISDKDSKKVLQEILALQNKDGGWSSSSLGKWERDDDNPVDRNSDGYGTGFSLFVLQRAGVKADHVSLKKGIAWLKTNQRIAKRIES